MDTEETNDNREQGDNRTKFLYFLFPFVLGICGYSALQVFQAWNDEDKLIAAQFNYEVKIHQLKADQELAFIIRQIVDRGLERSQFSRKALEINHDRQVSKDELFEVLLKVSRYISTIREDIGTLKGVSPETYPSYSGYISNEIKILESEEKSWGLYKSYLLTSGQFPKNKPVIDAAWLEFYNSISSIIQTSNAAISSAKSALVQQKIELTRTIAERKSKYVEISRIKRSLRMHLGLFIISITSSILLGFIILKGVRNKGSKLSDKA